MGPVGVGAGAGTAGAALATAATEAAGFPSAGGDGLLQAVNVEASRRRYALIRWEIIIWSLVCEGLTQARIRLLALRNYFEDASATESNK